MKLRLVGPLVVVALLALGACSADDDHRGMDDGAMGGSSRRSTSTTVAVPEDAEFNAVDVGFAQGMIVHHGQAVEMADQALRVSDDTEVVALAERIKAAQSPEIATMSDWLRAWNHPVPDVNAGARHGMESMGGMMMSGMMSRQDMRRLHDATGAAFDRMFLEMMVLHHEGAIEMARQLLADGEYPPTRQLAQDVVTTQQAEIDEMNGLLAARLGTNSSG